MAANVSVGSGSSFNLGSGRLNLGCADLLVAGTMNAGTSGFTEARHLTVDPAGVLVGNSATLEVTGDWDNAGTFHAGTSTVQLVDGCSVKSAVITGETTFANLEMTTTRGKLYSFEAGSTQTVAKLALLGAAGNLLTIRSTIGGTEAFLSLLGTNSSHFVDVDDNDATQGILITLEPNSVKGPNTPGWIRAALVPGLGALGVALLAASLVWASRRTLAERLATR